MDGKQVVITGATSGIGRATALALASLGANILMLSRNQKAGINLTRQIAASSPGVQSEFIEMDLSSLTQVRETVAKIRRRLTSVDILINNTGARFDRYSVTADGCERTFATNHLGHFLLTGKLLEQLQAAPHARVITVSSSASAQADNNDRWQFGAADFDRKQAYAKSKLANLVFAFELARRCSGTSISSLAVDPGIVATRFARNNGVLPWLKHLIYHGRKGELLNSARGADTLIYLASTAVIPGDSPEQYFRERQLIRACPAAYDPAAAANLWALSASLCGEDPFRDRVKN
jgi:NAD(P)-dependent dehydrogenase (short-subunit alcohol dehydrogenase family)